MSKPLLAVIATMLLSWGLALAIQTVRTHDPSTDIIVMCCRCYIVQRQSPAPVYSCYHCGRYQVAVSMTVAARPPDETYSDSLD